MRLEIKMKFKNYLNESTSEAFFVTPYGKVINIQTTHIDSIIKNPKVYGYTIEKIKEIYNKYNEKLGVEGKARDEIIKSLINKGWVRIRRYPNKQWSITINKMNKKIENFLYRFMNAILKGIAGFKETDKYMPVNIISLSDNNVIKSNVDDISKDYLYIENEILFFYYNINQYIINENI